jgi:hypothetical protein
VIGVGLPRTGTKSLQAALERLLGGRCYHMHEVFDNLDHVDVWQAALAGHPPDWRHFLGDYSAAVDWPVAAFWQELNESYPDAIMLLSLRADARTWWGSANSTVLQAARDEQPAEYARWQILFRNLLAQRFTPDWDRPEAAMAAYERHNQAVQDGLRGRLVEWHVEEGWQPICRALGVPVPDEPFPHLNSRAEWAAGDSDGA